MAGRKASLTPGMVFVPERERYTLRQYCEMYKQVFPSFLTVTQGYYGGNEMEVLGNGQVLRINSCVCQKRAVAVDSNDRTLSIPTNYPVKFKVVNANNKPGKEEDTLCNILVKKPLPVRIQLSDPTKISFSLNNAVHNVQTLGILTVRELYEETYLLANAIDQNGEPNNTALLIPLYLGDILVTALTGIEGKTQLEWKAYQDQTTEECKRIKIPLDTGLKEIALYSPQTIKSSDNVYDYIEPTSYIVAEWDGKADTEETKTVTKPSLRRPPPPKPDKPLKPPKPLPQSSKEEESPPTLPVREIKSSPRQGSIKSDRPLPEYKNVIGRAAVAPFSQIAKDAAQKVNESETKGQGQDKLIGQGQAVSHEEENKPENKPVNKLSIEEIGLRLKELKLDKYVKTFKEQGVDGELALELDETILHDDFKFSKFESLKFLKFVRTGHIPK